MRCIGRDADRCVLLERPKKKALVWYTTAGPAKLQAGGNEFQKEYPFIKPPVVAGSGVLLNKMRCKNGIA